ncbi:FtsB family cell division protein [Arthrobacter humicola]|uniref:FtsB family cell division protein n=1 Tax=Arthrobacter humicola TaxID=409291 RepID=UPI001FAE1EEF|nr:septum formation initiator family protein [Arthrobacter humicola]MCI9871014.1 septum formation initiator family protein [Arthrobacter humicola]
MATRRPNVPRATPAAKAAAAKPAATGLGAAADGGEVIQADFGGARSGTAAPAGAAPAPPRVSASTGKPAPGSSGAASAAKPRPVTAPAGAPAKPESRPAAGKDGAKSGSRTDARTGGKNQGRTAAGGPDESLDPVPAKAFSGRLLALGVVMIAITILLAPTVKIFLDKRAEIAALQADIAAKQTKQEDLKRQVSRWQDPNYVKQQARDRINMVMPGETGYWVFGSDLPAAQSGGAAGAASAQDPANLPWVDALWESIRRSATD